MRLRHKMVGALASVGIILGAAGAAEATVSSIQYAGNVSSSTAAAHLGGASSYGAHIYGTYWGRSSTALSVQIATNHIYPPAKTGYPWRRASFGALKLYANGALKVEAQDDSNGFKSVYCANGVTKPGTVAFSYSANRYYFTIPWTTLAACGISKGQTVTIKTSSYVQVDTYAGTYHWGQWYSSNSGAGFSFRY